MEISEAQIRYLKEVLGVEQILWKSHRDGATTPSSEATPPSSEATVNRPRIAVFVEKTNNAERELLTKMLTAMKLSSNDYEVIEDPSNDVYLKTLARSPILGMVFGLELAEKLSIQFQRGKFANQHGIATVVTYGPSSLTKNPELKAEAWKDMKLGMTRLGPT